MSALLRAGRALVSGTSLSGGELLADVSKAVSCSFTRVAHSSSSAAPTHTPTVNVQDELYSRHRSIMDLGSRRVDGRYSSYVVVDPGATVVGDVDLSVRVRSPPSLFPQE